MIKMALTLVAILCVRVAAGARAMDFSIGNDVPLHVMPLEEARKQMEAIAKEAKAAQVTAFEPYVKWSMMEKQEGAWDFSLYDMEVRELGKQGIKWVPFLIAG